MKCCFWCLEKCIKFLNRNAYIMVSSAATLGEDPFGQVCEKVVNCLFLFSPDCHLWQKFLPLSPRCLFPSHEKHYQVGFYPVNIYSYPFCSQLIWFVVFFHHRVAVLDKVTDFLLFLGKLLIVGIVGMRAFIFRPTLSGVTIGVSLLNPLTGFLSKQGFSLSSSSLGESKQWRTPLRLSTTTGCPYWSADLYWLVID